MMLMKVCPSSSSERGSNEQAESLVASNFIHHRFTTMAARKSCTHLSWSEAKARSGLGIVKNKKVLRKQDHGQLLAQKVIAKHRVESMDKKEAKAERKMVSKLEFKAQQREQERIQARQEAQKDVRPYDRAKEQCESVFRKAVEAVESKMHTKMLLDVYQMQVDELRALEAMIPEPDLAISPSLDEVEELIANESTSLPILTCFLRIECNQEDRNCLILVRLEFPSTYLDEDHAVAPLVSIPYCMVTDPTEYCSPDKPLQSLLHVRMDDCIQGLDTTCRQEWTPYPCVYASMEWLQEHMWDYVDE